MSTKDTMNGKANVYDKFNASSTVPLWLDGKEIAVSSTFDVISPLTQEVLYKVSSASEQDAVNAVVSAEKAFQTWSIKKPAARRDIFLRAAEIFAERQDSLWEIARNETGAPSFMGHVELHHVVEACKTAAGLISAVQGSIPTVAAEGQSALVLKEPYGVILGIAPWNAPYNLGVRACIGPLAMGNTVVLKGPESAPLTFWAISSVLHEAGLPAGCLNTIYHRSSDAARITHTLIAHPSIKKINFTGSSAVGSAISSLAGKHLKPVLMELGGKAPCIVCEDADLQLAAAKCVAGAFLHSGQICMSTERIIVRAEVVEDFKRVFTSSLENLNGHGGKSELCTLISAAAVTRTKKLLADATSKGAKMLVGSADEAVTEGNDCQMRRMAVENVDPTMDIYSAETFGPSVTIYVVNTDEEAIRLANDTEYGLSSAVFTEDLRRGLKIARAIESGAVHINSMTIHDESVLPHGGCKKSGFGRFNGIAGLNEWVKTKVVTWKD